MDCWRHTKSKKVAGRGIVKPGEEKVKLVLLLPSQELGRCRWETEPYLILPFDETLEFGAFLKFVGGDSRGLSGGVKQQLEGWPVRSLQRRCCYL